jgi:adenylate kinase family enzyme
LQRVLILGSPGAGKTVAARALADVTGLPAVHLDGHFWQPGWRESDRDVWRATVEGLSAAPGWIMDGNYLSTLAPRLARADTLIHLDYQTWFCLWRVLRRTLAVWGRTRDELPPQCPERFDREFLIYVLRYRRDQRPRDMAAMAAYAGEVHRFTHPSQLAAFIAVWGRKQTGRRLTKIRGRARLCLCLRK